MRRKTEFTERPSQFQVLRNGTLAIVRMRENIVQLEQREDGDAERWEADEYDLACRWTDNIESRISQNTEAWLLMAKETDAMEKPTQDERLEAVESALLDLILGGAV